MKAKNILIVLGKSILLSYDLELHWNTGTRQIGLFGKRKCQCILSEFREKRQTKKRMLMPIANKNKIKRRNHNKVTINKNVSCLSHLILTTALSDKYYFYPICQRSKLKLREVQHLAQNVSSKVNI